MWTTAFIALLIINLSIIATGGLNEPAYDGESADDYALLDATDEVSLDWWPGEGNVPGPGVAEGEGSRADPVLVHIPDIETTGVREFKNYPQLMAGYIKRVNGYLIKYYHIMSETAPSPEDRG